MAMEESRRRRAANEAVFREVNERIEALDEQLIEREGDGFEIVCECHRLDCMERLHVEKTAYERIRSESALFFVRAGHQDPTAEDVVDSAANYLIVRKHPGIPQQVAEATDPRA
jgi:hypothetical protein